MTRFRPREDSARRPHPSQADPAFVQRLARTSATVDSLSTHTPAVDRQDQHLVSLLRIPQASTAEERPSDPDAPIRIVRAEYDDIPEIVQIHIEAYQNDLTTRMQNNEAGGDERKREFIDKLRELWSNKAVWPMKALRGNDILGVGLYAIRDGSVKDGGAGAETAEEPLESTLLSLRTGSGGLSAMAEHESIGDMMHKQMSAMQNKWVGGCKMLYLASLAVRPRAQARGVGGALLRAGIKKADELGLVIWLEATPAGHPVYEHLGWKTVDEIHFDLSEWAGKDKGYGVYRFWGCLRLPAIQ